MLHLMLEIQFVPLWCISSLARCVIRVWCSGWYAGSYHCITLMYFSIMCIPPPPPMQWWMGWFTEINHTGNYHVILITTSLIAWGWWIQEIMCSNQRITLDQSVVASSCSACVTHYPSHMSLWVEFLSFSHCVSEWVTHVCISTWFAPNRLHVAWTTSLYPQPPLVIDWEFHIPMSVGGWVV
jgi:hypothetical protein